MQCILLSNVFNAAYDLNINDVMIVMAFQYVCVCGIIGHYWYYSFDVTLSLHDDKYSDY